MVGATVKGEWGQWMEATKSWLQQHDIVEVECIVADLNGVLRGKLLPVSKFVKSLADNALFLPSSTFLVCIDGRYSGSFDEGFGYACSIIICDDRCSVRRVQFFGLQTSFGRRKLGP